MEEMTDETIDEATDGTDEATEATSDVAGFKIPFALEAELGSMVAVVEVSWVVGCTDSIVDVALSSYQHGSKIKFLLRTYLAVVLTGAVAFWYTLTLLMSQYASL
jgi:hypothetical protein